MIVRSRGAIPYRNYVRVPNYVARGGLSLAAVGLYTYLASVPQDFEVNLRDDRPWTNGYKATRIALEELRRAGLVSSLRRERKSGKAGRAGQFDYFIYVYRDRLAPTSNPVDVPVENLVGRLVDNLSTVYGPAHTVKRIP